VAFAFSKTDEEFLELQNHEDVDVQALVECRLGNKSTIEQSRTERFIGISTRGTLPVPLQYYAAHTGRFGGTDKINLQNLPRDGVMRKAIVAPAGHVLVVADSSQIEARMVAWLAQEHDLIEAFRSGADIYSLFATDVFGVQVTKKDKERRFVGKTSILGLGYGMGGAKFQNTLRKGQGGVRFEMDTKEANGVVQLYRGKYTAITALWKQGTGVLNGLVAGESGAFGRAGVVTAAPADEFEGIPRIILPNTMAIRYPGLRSEMGEKGPQFQYQVKEGRRVYETRIYGGKLTENCLAGNTRVLTGRGWINLVDVTNTDLVHDGVEFVNHGGVVYNGVQTTNSTDGVWVTDNHLILDTNHEWKTASSKPRLYRPDLRGVAGVEPRAFRRKEKIVDVSLPVRENSGESRVRCEQRSGTRRDTQLWLSNKTTNLQGEYKTRYVSSSSIYGVVKYVSKMSARLTSGIQELRWAWDICLRRLVGVQSVLAGHGSNVHSGSGVGEDRQQPRLQQGQLPMGESTYQLHEQAGDTSRDRCTLVKSANGHPQINPLLQTESRVVGRATYQDPEPIEQGVYDILNCGPRNRFVVLGNEGPFIVHNCVQALARIVITDQWIKIKNRAIKERVFHRSPVVGQVHDELICCVPAAAAEDMKAIMIEEMHRAPAWAEGLPVACEADIAERYGDAK
jgi:hypothetical protein